MSGTCGNQNTLLVSHARQTRTSKQRYPKEKGTTSIWTIFVSNHKDIPPWQHFGRLPFVEHRVEGCESVVLKAASHKVKFYSFRIDVLKNLTINIMIRVVSLNMDYHLGFFISETCQVKIMKRNTIFLWRRITETNINLNTKTDYLQPISVHNASRID